MTNILVKYEYIGDLNIGSHFPTPAFHPVYVSDNLIFGGEHYVRN